MPQRTPPKAYQLLLKTHKLTIFLTAHPSSTVAELKEEALSALTSAILSSSSSSAVPRIPTAPGEDVDMMDEEEASPEVPRVESTEDFELCRVVRDKWKSNAALSGPAPTSYEILDSSTPIKGLLNNWEILYVQFRDNDRDLLPVQVSQPCLLDEEDEEPRRAPPAPELVNKGKRKAPSE